MTVLYVFEASEFAQWQNASDAFSVKRRIVKMGMPLAEDIEGAIYSHTLKVSAQQMILSMAD